MPFDLKTAKPLLANDQKLPGEPASNQEFEHQWSDSMAKVPNSELGRVNTKIEAENNTNKPLASNVDLSTAKPSTSSFDLSTAKPIYATGTGTRYTQQQLDAAKNPNSLKQDIQSEMAKNPIMGKLASAGTALSDLYYGGKQLLGMDSTENRRDIANNKTIASVNPMSALAGNVGIGVVGGMVAGGALKGVQVANKVMSGVKGAAASGAALGALAPTENDSVLKGKLENTAMGTGVGLAGGLVAKGLGKYINTKQLEDSASKAKNAVFDDTLKNANDAGYKVSPTYAGAGKLATSLEGISGKYKTNEAVRIDNQDVTNSLAKKGLGLPENSSLSSAVIDELKAPHNAIYQEASSLPSGVVSQETTKSLGTGNMVTKDITKSGEQLVNQIKNAKDDSRAAWKSFNSGISSNPNDLRTQAIASGKLADSLENQLQTLAEKSGKTDLVDQLKNARKNLAKINLYDDALNPETGDINAKVFGKALSKGKPLDDYASKIGSFANAFSDLAKVPKSREASSITALDMIGGALTAGIAPAARIAARSAVLSTTAQRAIANKSYSGTNNLTKALASRNALMALTGGAVPSLSK